MPHGQVLPRDAEPAPATAPDRELSFAVALPMYNEEECAERSIRAIFAALESITKHRTAIIAVNDGSKDRTLEIITGLLSEYPRLIVHSHEKNRGYGGAIKSAYQVAAQNGIEYVLFMDSDLTQDPKFISDFIPFMQKGIGMIKASRYVSGGKVENVPLFRIVISRVGNLLARFLYGLPIRDYTNGFRAVRTDISSKFDLQSNGFEILMEEVYQAKSVGATFAELPYVLSARKAEDGKSSFSYKPRVFYNYLRYGFLTFFGVTPQHLRGR